MTGLYWRPKRQISLEKKPGREEKDVVKGQKVGWTRDSQSMRKHGKGRKGRQREYGWWRGEEDNKGKRRLAKGENNVMFQRMLAGRGM